MWKTRWDQIEEVEVERASDSFVWINGRRNAIRSSYENYHGTFDAAMAWLVTKAETELAIAHRALDLARSKLETVKALKPNTKVQSRETAKEKT